jgi:hemolysin activation/secretion protein
MLLVRSVSSRRSSRSVGLPLACLLAAAGLMAAPDAGSLQQGIDRERKPTVPAKPAPTLTPAKPVEPGRGEATVIVKQFTLTGNKLISEAELQAVLKSYANRALTMAELQKAADAVVQYYLDRGYLVRTLLPKQDVTEGLVRIQVIESVFSGVEIETKLTDKRITEDRLRNTVAAQIQPGDPMSLKKLERGLMLANDIPGVNVSGRLVAGAADLTTGVVLNVSDEPLIYGETALDNFGTYSTGDARFTVNATMGGGLKMGDQLSLFTMKTEGIEFARLGFSLPAGYDGWRVGANASTMRYKIVEGPEGKGTSVVLGLDASYPIYRSRPDNLYYVANLDKKFFDNIGPTGDTTTKYSSLVFTTGFNGSMTDKFLPGGLTAGNIMLTVGNINLDGSPNQADDLATVNAQGGFERVKYGVTHTQNITSNLTAFVSYTGQLAGKNLDSSEKFYLGGPLGVRAYPNNEGAGSDGQLLTFELRQNLTSSLELTAFYDRGQVTVNKDNDFVGAADPNRMSYEGAGLQLTWFGPRNSNVKVIWSHRLGDNPFPSSTGADQDGTMTLNRVWVSASIAF